MWSESPVTGERKVRLTEVQYFDGGHTGSGRDGIWTQLLLIHCTVPMFPGFEYDAKNSASMYMCMLSHFGRVWLFVTPWTIPCQAMGFSRHEYWRGLPCPPPGDLPNPGIEPASLISPVLAGGFFIPLTSPGKPSLYPCAKSVLGDRVSGEVEKDRFIALPEGEHSRLIPSKLCVPALEK